jgi:hypothetical protein
MNFLWPHGFFGAVGVGVECPSSMEEQFNEGGPWSVISNDSIVGGHYIPCVGKNSVGNYLFITWGRVQAATPEWVSKYMDEAICYLDLEIINNSTKLSPESFNADSPHTISERHNMSAPSDAQVAAACAAARKAIQDYSSWDSAMVPDDALENVVVAALKAALNVPTPKAGA